MADSDKTGLAKSIDFSLPDARAPAQRQTMAWSVFTQSGQRKYLLASERAAFASAARRANDMTGSFCMTLAFTGARISEVLALTHDRIDFENSALVFETLKRRQRGIFRAVPVPPELLSYLDAIHEVRNRQNGSDRTNRLWPYSRPTAWKWVKDAMRAANIDASIAKPKALRHAFGVQAVQDRIALSLVQKWLGHAKIETTAIYATPIGEEERALARLTWMGLMPSLRPQARKLARQQRA